MAEKVVVHQNAKLETIFMIQDLESPEGSKLVGIDRIHQLTPYGMLLASLGSCTAITLHTYAQNHKISLEEVEIRLDYERIFKNDCEHCEEIEDYREEITELITLTGTLTEEETQKLLKIAHRCPVTQMVTGGIPVKTSLLGTDEIRAEGRGLEGRS